MDGFINLIGGYDSCLFAIITVGGFIVMGTVMMAVDKYYIKIPATGIFMFASLLMYSYLNYFIQQQEDIPEIATIVPVLWAVIVILTSLTAYTKAKQNDKED